MAYGNDATVFVEDKAGDQGAPSTAPWWLSPDVDIPATPGEAQPGSNDVRIRVHTHEEPIIEEKIVAEVYVGDPSLVMSPTTATARIDPGNLRFRPPNVAGTEPVANQTGGTLSFAWTPSSTAGNVNGPGHRCLVVRAFPESVTPPSSAFDVPNEQHEAQRNIVILSTEERMKKGKKAGAGTPDDPRRRDPEDGLWWQDLLTLAVGRKRGRRYVVAAFDPDHDRLVAGLVRPGLKAAGVRRLSDERPDRLDLKGLGAKGAVIDPGKLLGKRRFASASGLGSGIWSEEHLLGAAVMELGPRRPTQIQVGIDHSNIRKGSAALIHLAQFDERGRPEGGITVAAVAPR
jgi:hypothetical protein